ncbi:MAG: hypothetical protein MJK10_13130 [Pseudomonadales bacterium]|nr:hypothetical protein [Pseudomonadales bacterium]NRA16949.1 hypothetical protein [Oceanospirillaceae bacterium]
MQLATIKQLMFTVFFSIFSTVAAADLAVVEWAPFVKNSPVTDRQLMAAADKVNIEFLSQQPGFIKRQLVKKNDTDYADIVYWATAADAGNAAAKVQNCSVCGEYFKLMDMQASATSGAGFAHYQVLVNWN